MELGQMKQGDKRVVGDDEVDFKISKKTRDRAIKLWIIVNFILSWMSVAFYIWDDTSAFLAYNYWNVVITQENLRSCLTAWLVFACFGVAITALVTYNTLCHSLKFLCKITRAHALRHQYTVFIAYYVHEIPKSIVYLVLVAKFSIFPELQAQVRTPPSTYFLGQSKYDHIYFKIITDALKMLLLFILGVIEFREIAKKDKNKVFLALNSFAAFCHLCFLLASTVLKIILEKNG